MTPKLNDPTYFTNTSDESYDRHNYRVRLTNGKGIVLDDYEQVRGLWFQYEKQFLDTVEVLDKKATSSGGFK
jgi:hypothetical protein